MILAAVGAAVAATLSLSITVLLTTLVADVACRFGCSEETARLALGEEPLGSVLLYPLGSFFLLPFALMIVLPVMPVAYPLALAIAKFSRTPARTAAVGALAALIVVAPILLSALAASLSTEGRAGLVEGLPGALLTWSPAIAAAGAAVGWIVAIMHRSADMDSDRSSEGREGRR